MSNMLNFKSKKFWLILLFLIYSIFGWLGVPYIVKHQAINSLKEIARWDTKIESVVFNPYALSLAVHGFQAQDAFQQEVVSFERLFINFSALDSLSGQVAFDEVSLTRPVIDAQLDENGKSNFERDFVSPDAETKPKKTEESEPLAFFFGLISISQAQVNFSDRQTDETFELTLKPLNLALHDFSSNHNDGGDYSLNLSLGQEQELSWKGKIGIAPFSSKGVLALKNLRSSSFWHYAEPFSPYALQDALISLEGHYDAEFSEGNSRLIVDSGAFSISQLKLSETLDSEAFFKLDTLSLSPISFDLEERNTELGNLLIVGPELRARKEKTAEINLLRPLQQSKALSENNNKTSSAPEVSEAKDEQTPHKPFEWSVSSVKLKEGLVNWQDHSLESPADMTLDKINIELGPLTHELSKTFPYQLSFNTGEAQQTLSGELAAAPLIVNGNVVFSSLPLTWLQPYIGEQLNVLLAQGQLNLSSDYRLGMGESGLSGEIISNTSVNALDIEDSILEQPLAGFQSLSISGAKLSLEAKLPPSIYVEEIKLSKPYAKAQISEQGKMNLAQLNKSNADSDDIDAAIEKESANPEKTDSQTESGQSANIAINNILIDDGRFDYIDASLTPVFNTYIEQFSGQVSDISSDIDAHSKVTLTGKLDSYGKIAIDGTSNPLSEQPNTSLTIQVSNIDLSTASPYAAKYAGYLIDKGKLNLDLAYDIQGSKLKANNEIFIDQFNFGKSVDSPDATVLPLPLALGIMKNLDGEIDIELPISGDLSDPSFSIGGVVLTAFTNLITKVVTSPFSILGSLVEGGDDISAVNFAALTSTLSPAQTTKLLKLAEALKKRPNLSLEVRGVADRSIDRDSSKQALSEDKLAILAKNRALIIAKALIEQGGIAEKRIFTLEPKILTSQHAKAQSPNKQIPSVPSVFTIKVN